MPTTVIPQVRNRRCCNFCSDPRHSLKGKTGKYDGCKIAMDYIRQGLCKTSENGFIVLPNGNRLHTFGKDIKEKVDNWYQTNKVPTAAEFIWMDTHGDEEPIVSKQEDTVVLETLAASIQKDADDGLITSEQYVASLETLIALTKKKIEDKRQKIRTHQRNSDPFTRPYSVNNESSHLQKVPNPPKRVNEPQNRCITPVEEFAWAKEVVQAAEKVKNPFLEQGNSIYLQKSERNGDGTYRKHPTITQSEDFEEDKPIERHSIESVVQKEAAGCTESQDKRSTTIEKSALAKEVVQTAIKAENPFQSQGDPINPQRSERNKDNTYRNHPMITHSEDFDEYKPNERFNVEDVVQTATTAENPVLEQGEIRNSRRSERSNDTTYQDHLPTAQSEDFEDHEPNEMTRSKPVVQKETANCTAPQPKHLSTPVEGLIESVEDEVLETPIVLYPKESLTIWPEVRPIKDLVTAKQITHPDRTAKAALIEMENDGGRAETVVVKATRGINDSIVAIKGEDASYELFRPFCTEIQATHLEFSNKNSQHALEPNIQINLVIPIHKDRSIETTCRSAVVEVDDPSQRQENSESSQRSARDNDITYLVMCRLGSAWKPRLRLGFFRLRSVKIEARAERLGLGRLGLGLGLGRGFCLFFCLSLANTEVKFIESFLLVNS
jgi:hypothetical protein